LKARPLLVESGKGRRKKASQVGSRLWSNHHFSVAGKHCRSSAISHFPSALWQITRLPASSTDTKRVEIEPFVKAKTTRLELIVLRAANSSVRPFGSVVRLSRCGCQIVGQSRLSSAFLSLWQGQLLGEKSRSVGQFKNVLWATRD